MSYGVLYIIQHSAGEYYEKKKVNLSLGSYRDSQGDVMDPDV